MDKIMLIWTILVMGFICWGIGTFIAKQVIPNKYSYLQENPIIQFLMGFVFLIILVFWFKL